jgi:hypothetical protein
MGVHEASLGAAPCAPKLSDWIRSYGERTVATLAPSLCHPRVCARDSLFLVVGLNWNWCDMHAILHQAILFSVAKRCSATLRCVQPDFLGRAGRSACSTMMRTAEGCCSAKRATQSLAASSNGTANDLVSQDLRSGRKS